MKNLILSAILSIASVSFSQNQLITIGTIGYDIINTDLILTYDSIDTELLVDIKEIVEIESTIIVTQTYSIDLVQNKFSIIENGNYQVFNIYFTRLFTQDNKEFMEIMIYTSDEDFCPYMINFTDKQLESTCSGVNQKFKTVVLVK